jgi:hypothetical protein
VLTFRRQFSERTEHQNSPGGSLSAEPYANIEADDVLSEALPEVLAPPSLSHTAEPSESVEASDESKVASGVGSSGARAENPGRVMLCVPMSPRTSECGVGRIGTSFGLRACRLPSAPDKRGR